jgi:hypothetical protein
LKCGEEGRQRIVVGCGGGVWEGDIDSKMEKDLNRRKEKGIE